MDRRQVSWLARHSAKANVTTLVVLLPVIILVGFTDGTKGVPVVVRTVVCRPFSFVLLLYLANQLVP